MSTTPSPLPVNPAASGAPIAPEPRKKSFFARHKILTVIGVLIVLGVVVKVASGGGSDEADRPAATASADSVASDAAEDTGPGIGTAVRDGKFEFTVTSIEPGVAHLGTDVVGTDAQGQFVLVHVTVANIGDKAQLFSSSDQKLFDTAGREHSADSGAAIYLGDADSLLAEINPGNAVEGTLVFDIPADAVPASIELHDSMFSGGVTVSLG